MPLLFGEEDGDIDSCTSDVSEVNQDELDQMLKVGTVFRNYYTFFHVVHPKLLSIIDC